MKTSLHIIHVEDSAQDSEIVEQMLLSNGINCEINRVETRTQLMAALQESQCDLVLSDCTLPRFHGLEALEVARAIKPEIPFIFVSGTMGEETAIESLQNGATDYVLKHRLSRLVPAVRRALAEAEGRKSRAIMETSLHQSQKLASIGRSVGGVAHDIKNLLQALKLNSTLLPLQANDPEAIAQIAERFDKIIDRGCHMMQELLVFARETETHLVPVDVAAQIRDLLQILEVGLPSNIGVHLHLEDNLPQILADPGQFDRILTNLLVNARDAMPEGGKIMISTDLIRFGQIPINSWQTQDNPHLRLIISDTGMGMDERVQSRIFEPFFTTKPEGKGTGLGLSVVFGLMEAHSGFIDLESKVGEGTTFSLFFPLAHEEETIPNRVHVISPIRLLGNVAHSEVGAR